MPTQSLNYKSQKLFNICFVLATIKYTCKFLVVRCKNVSHNCIKLVSFEEIENFSKPQHLLNIGTYYWGNLLKLVQI